MARFGSAIAALRSNLAASVCGDGKRWFGRLALDLAADAAAASERNALPVTLGMLGTLQVLVEKPPHFWRGSDLRRSRHASKMHMARVQLSQGRTLTLHIN